MLQKIIDNHIHGFLIVNRDMEIVYSNKFFEKYFGKTESNLCGNYINCVSQLELGKKCKETEACKQCSIKNNVEIFFEVDEKISDIKNAILNLKINGKECKIHTNFYLRKVEDNVILEFYNWNYDDQDEILGFSFLEKVVDKVEDMIFYKNKKLEYLYVNSAYAKFLNQPKYEILGKTDSDLLLENTLKINEEKDLKTFEEKIQKYEEKIGDKVYSISKQVIEIENEEGILAIIKDISKEKKIKESAEIDSLTGIYNRRKYNEVLEKKYQNKEENTYLLLIDLDNLRKINNDFGHLEGDNSLKKVASILEKISEHDFFRLGGDEFAGVINSSRKEGIENICEEIREELKKLSNEKIKLSVSIGVKKIDYELSKNENFELADKYLYAVKLSKKGEFNIEN
nr:diguanylate cyclase [uncultured Cetobacterium sp.]